MDNQPLAEQMRPKRLSEIVGQQQVLGPNTALRTSIEQDNLSSLILWGPPGSGKTTLARVIANEVVADFVELSAVQAGKKDVIEVVKHAQTNQRLGQKTILFIDEIHRFNKAQQDAFLPYVEDGTIILIGATTENPSFEVITPLLSRSRVVVLEPLSTDSVSKIIKTTLKKLKQANRFTPKAIELLAHNSGGDARVALGNVELLLKATSKTEKITPKVITTTLDKKLPVYDKAGEGHYNLISAFIKSMRGSDPSSTFYYLARMLEAGEDPKFIARRMVIFVSEDVGIAASQALNVAVSTFQAVEQIGMPECRYNLFHCALVLAKCKKSRQVTDAMSRGYQLVNSHPDLPVPLHLRNAPTELMRQLDYGKDYEWKADFKHDRGFLPDEINDIDLFSDA